MQRIFKRAPVPEPGWASMVVGPGSATVLKSLAKIHIFFSMVYPNNCSKLLCFQSSIYNCIPAVFFYYCSIPMSLYCSKEGLKEHRSFFNEENIRLALLLSSYRVRARGLRWS